MLDSNTLVPHQLALILALAATFCFSSSSLVYAEFSKRVSVLWMNCFKTCFAVVLLALTIPIFSGWHTPEIMSVVGFMSSGFIGLNLGDLFLLSAFTRLGAARTLILFGFQPLFMAIAAALLFNQNLEPQRLLAVIFLIGCLVVFSLEKYRADRKWELWGFAAALIGVILDTGGILLSRASYDLSPALAPMEGHFYRCLGAALGFFVISFFKPIRLVEGFKRWNVRTRTLIIAAAFGGTYLSLIFYLTAIKIGHLASISSIAITGPMFAATLECIFQRKWPSAYLVTAFALFCTGFYILAIASS